MGQLGHSCVVSDKSFHKNQSSHSILPESLTGRQRNRTWIVNQSRRFCKRGVCLRQNKDPKWFFLSSTDFSLIGNLAALCTPYGAEKRFLSSSQDSVCPVVSKTWLAVQLSQSEADQGHHDTAALLGTEITCPKAGV